MQKKPLMILAALAAATEPDFGRNALDRLKSGIREKYKDDPMGSTITTVVVASWLFYKAEHGHNEKVKSFYDALVYVSTNMSVGYSDIFAKTPGGKAVGTFLMTFGPAMTGGLMDEPRREEKEDEDAKAVVDRLDRILAVLEAQVSAASRAGDQTA